jgi:hemerythrin-like domain-containing protein
MFTIPKRIKFLKMWEGIAVKRQEDEDKVNRQQVYKEIEGTMEPKDPGEWEYSKKEDGVMERKVMDKPKDALMAVKGPPETYTPIHKGLRSRLFKTSIQAGKIDYFDEASLSALYDEFNSLVASIRLHHTMEENFIHPLLSDRVPGGAEKLEEEHHVVDHLMDNLVAHLDRIKGQSTKFEKRRELGLEFYLAFNRFIAFFLNHIDGEEEHIRPTLWRLCTAEEVTTAVVKLLASQKPEEGLQNLEMMFNAANTDDLAGLITHAKAALPPEAIKAGLQLAEGILSPRDFAALKAKIGSK